MLTEPRLALTQTGKVGSVPDFPLSPAPPGAGFTSRRAERRPRAGVRLWTAGAQLPLFPILWPERRQPCCRTPKQLPLHDDFAYGLGLSLRLRFTHEVDAGRQCADVVCAYL